MNNESSIWSNLQYHNSFYTVTINNFWVNFNLALNIKNGWTLNIKNGCKNLLAGYNRMAMRVSHSNHETNMDFMDFHQVKVKLTLLLT